VSLYLCPSIYLIVGEGNNNNMVNDMTNLSVSGISDGSGDWQLDGNPLAVSAYGTDSIGAIIQSALGSSRTITINCDLSFPYGGDIQVSGSGADDTAPDKAIHFYMNGALNVGTNEVAIYSDTLILQNVLGDNYATTGDVHINGMVTGSGELYAYCDGESGFAFGGSTPNTFEGNLVVSTGVGADLVFDKSSGGMLGGFGTLTLTNAAVVRCDAGGQWIPGAGLWALQLPS
jgi:hypothetical protein